MIVYAWDDKYLIGHAEVDRQHRRLFAILNELYTAMKAQRGAAGIEAALDDLTRYAEEHFASEEQVMADCAFPELEQHRAAHQRFTAQVRELRRRGATGLHAFELLNFIGGWIVEHVGQSDVAIGKHLRLQAAQAAWDRQLEG